MAKIIQKYDSKIEFGYGSTTGHPDFKGMQTCDIKLWVRLGNYEWFKPYGNFNESQIVQMIDLCHNNYQVVSLMELLSAKPENRIRK